MSIPGATKAPLTEQYDFDMNYPSHSMQNLPATPDTMHHFYTADFLSTLKNLYDNNMPIFPGQPASTEKAEGSSEANPEPKIEHQPIISKPAVPDIQARMLEDMNSVITGATTMSLGNPPIMSNTLHETPFDKQIAKNPNIDAFIPHQKHKIDQIIQNVKFDQVIAGMAFHNHGYIDDKWLNINSRLYAVNRQICPLREFHEAIPQSRSTIDCVTFPTFPGFPNERSMSIWNGIILFGMIDYSTINAIADRISSGIDTTMSNVTLKNATQFYMYIPQSMRLTSNWDTPHIAYTNSLVLIPAGEIIITVKLNNDVLAQKKKQVFLQKAAGTLTKSAQSPQMQRHIHATGTGMEGLYGDNTQKANQMFQRMQAMQTGFK